MDFLCITFGPAEDVKRNGYWNCKERFSSRRQAERKGLDSLCIGGTLGYVVIEDGWDSWRIVDESGTKNTSVSYRNGTYSVSPAPKLTLV